MNTKPALILMTRWPAAGRCKSRLAAKIGSFNAANIQARLTAHTFEVAKNVEQKGLVEIKLAITGLAYKRAKKWAYQQGINKIQQQGKGSLGVRMRRQVLRSQKQNCNRKVIIIGTDLPSLCERDLIIALENLNNYQAVIGPSKDGGYWLLGLSERLMNPVSLWPFTGIPWGSDQVLAKTIETSRVLNINYCLVRQQNDLDQIEDLSPWQG